MIKLSLSLLIYFFITPLFGCQRVQNNTQDIDTNSYINEFELLQENPKNDYSILISSPKAIINPLNNDIQIFDSSIEIINENGQDIIVKSGNSNLNNSINSIRVFNNVNISLVEKKNYFMKTDSFNWNLKTSNIDLDSPLMIFFGNTIISSSNGSYNINSSLLEINNNIFKRIIFNEKAQEQYQVEIISDIAKWLKDGNNIEFNSNNKQVETTINFLSSK